MHLLHHSGVFDTAGDVSLQLLVDIKTDGVEFVSLLAIIIFR